MIYFLVRQNKKSSPTVLSRVRVEPYNVYLALRSSKGSILDVLGMVCDYFKLKEKYLERLLCDYTAFKVEFGHKTNHSSQCFRSYNNVR